MARAAIEQGSGTLLELRGDEALAVFVSARDALRTSLELQRRFAEETRTDPSLPLRVGIGMDAGEALPVQGGYRGGALNLAARLCGRAGAGEVLASQGVVHLARTIEGIRYEDLGELEIKGMAKPVNAVRVVARTE